MKRILIPLLPLILMLTGCQEGSKYREEKQVIENYNSIINRFSEKMENSHATEEMLNCTYEFIQQIRPLIPKIRGLKKSHPEWEHEPPKELKEPLDEYHDTMIRFGKAAEKFYNWHMKYPHDYPLERAYNLLRKLIGDM
jgi:CRISPR/Cas system-associated protein Cas5 (RAMP superfamily)